MNVSSRNWTPLVITLAMWSLVCPTRADRVVSSLDGKWSFRLDPQDAGHRERWFEESVPFTNTIQVPGAWQAQGSGAESDKLHHHYEGKAWYKREVRLPNQAAGRRVFLCFGGVHRSAEVWVNGRFLGEHLGYLSPFEFDVTSDVAGARQATITLCVDCRQRWDVDCLTGCFDIIDAMFTPWGGLWGHAGLETRSAAWLEDVFVRPSVTPAGCAVTARVVGNETKPDRVRLEILSRTGKVVARTERDWAAQQSVSLSPQRGEGLGEGCEEPIAFHDFSTPHPDVFFVRARARDGRASRSPINIEHPTSNSQRSSDDHLLLHTSHLVLPSTPHPGPLLVRGGEGARVRRGIDLDDPAALQAASPIPSVQLETKIPGARLWSPESPYLYTARLTLFQGKTVLDQVRVPFGLREIQIRGSDFFLNGQKLFLRGYGDDAIYPKTMAAPADKAFYRERLKAAKAYGFNYVRHHSHILPPEYYEAADEVGMLVSAEFPIAYEQYYQRAKGPALDLYKREWVEAIKRLRNHPSIFDWCMGNEMWGSFPLAPELYRLARDLDPTRPVIDSDGLGSAGFLNGTKDRPTLDFFPVQFDEGSLPFDRPGKHRFEGVPKKPVLSHETGNYATVPRLDLIAEFQDNFKPFWLVPFRDKLLQLGLQGEAAQWSRNSERLYLLSHKLNLEDLRKNPRLSGYMWWLLQDYWTGANGLFDTYFRRKSITPGEVRRFNDPVVLLQDGWPLTCQAKQSLRVRLLVSNYALEPIRHGKLRWKINLEKHALANGECRLEARQGELAEATFVELTLPAVSQPRRLTLTAELLAANAGCRNDWATWLYPDHIEVPHLPVPLFAGHDLASSLATFSPQRLLEADALPSRAVYVVSQPTSNLLNAAAAGACLVCLSPQGVFPTVPNRFKPAWWLGSESDCNAGTVVYPHPVTRAIAPEGWCDAGWHRLLEGAQAYVLNEFPAQPAVLVRGLDVHTVCRSKALLFEAGVGHGSIIVSGLKLAGGAGGGSPEAQWLLARLLEHAGTLPRPKATLPVGFLRAQIDKVPAPEGPFVSGFTRVLSPDAEQADYASYRDKDAPLFVCRQTAAGRTLEWETVATPFETRHSPVTFVFAGGLGWRSQPKTDGFALLVNGRELLRFDIARDYHVWSAKDRAGKLWFVPKKLLPEDALGLFYLSVPGQFLKPGEPCRLTVRSLGQGSRRWFGLNPFMDLGGS